MRFRRLVPAMDWLGAYSRQTLTNDALAALIVTIMLIPQSLAYAMLAGLPPEAGLYASMLPLLGYALFGSSRTLAVGPVAVVSLMTATAIGGIAEAGSEGYVVAALSLALLSGAMLIAVGLFRLGFLANFLSHPVVTGFTAAASVLIAAGQLKHIFGIKAGGDDLISIAAGLARNLGDINLAAAAIGAGTLVFLFWVRRGLAPLLEGLGLSKRAAMLTSRAGPIVAVALGILAVVLLDLEAAGVAVVGRIPAGLPPLTMPSLDPDLLTQIAGAAALISLVGFVESISVARTLGAKRRERVDPDRELVGLGAANVAAAFTGGYPVTGGFARSVVNFDAGAETPAAGVMTAAGILIAALLLTPLLASLPQATLAATIIVAVLSLIDMRTIAHVWRYSKADFAALAITIVATLLLGVEIGISAGVVVALLLFLLRTSRPHYAIVGLVPGTQHFRNVLRHKVATSPQVIGLRVDESLYFANAAYLEDVVYRLIVDQPEARHVVLLCAAVNAIDASALESLEAINARLKDAGVLLHLSEVKGPVMDRLGQSDFLSQLTGQVFLSHYDAIAALAPELTFRSRSDK